MANNELFVEVKTLIDQGELSKAEKSIQKLTRQSKAYKTSLDSLLTTQGANTKETQEARIALERVNKELQQSIQSYRRASESQEENTDEQRSTNAALQKAERQLKQNVQQIRKYRAAVDATTEKQQQFNASQRSATGGIRNNSKAANNANQILFSFGDAVQDGAQFQFGFAQGARAVGNNLAFASEQIALAAGGLGAGFKQIGKAVFGPAGVILAINAAITAITVLSNKSSKAKKDMDELNSSISDFAKEASSIGDDPLFDPLGVVGIEQSLNQLEDLRVKLQRLFDLRERAEDLRAFITAPKAGFTSGVEEAAEEYANVNREIKSLEETFGELTETQEENIKTIIDQNEANLAYKNALIEQNEVLKLQRDITEDVSPVVKRYRLGLFDTTDALTDLRNGYIEQAQELRESGELTDEQVDKLFVLEKAIESLNDEIDNFRPILTEEDMGAFEGDLSLEPIEVPFAPAPEEGLRGFQDEVTERRAEQALSRQEELLSVRIGIARGFEREVLKLKKQRIDRENNLIAEGVDREKAARLAQLEFERGLNDAKIKEQERTERQKTEITDEAIKRREALAKDLAASTEAVNKQVIQGLQGIIGDLLPAAKKSALALLVPQMLLKK